MKLLLKHTIRPVFNLLSVPGLRHDHMLFKGHDSKLEENIHKLFIPQTNLLVPRSSKNMV